MSALFALDRTHVHDPAIEPYFAAHPPELSALARHWFRILRSAGDEAREALHDNAATACFGTYPFAAVSIHTAHVTLSFFRGAHLPDPAHLLQGAGKHMRHTKLTPQAAINEAALTALIQLAYDDIKHSVEID